MSPLNLIWIIPLVFSTGCGFACLLFANTLEAKKPETTRWICDENPWDGEVWRCEKCGLEWVFEEEGPAESEVAFCPCCGRKIIEFVPWKDLLLEEEEDDEGPRDTEDVDYRERLDSARGMK